MRNKNIGEIKIPILQVQHVNKIGELIKQHLENINKAIILENQAIDLIEKEIESWQE